MSYFYFESSGGLIGGVGFFTGWYNLIISII